MEGPALTGAISIRQFEKVVVVGTYGTGKTTWCRWLLGQMPRCLAFDPVWEQEAGVHSVAEAEQAFLRTGRSVFQPANAEDTFGPWLQMVLRQRNAMVYVDEPALVMDPKSKPPAEFSMLHRLGHKVGLGVMLSTHRIKGDLPTFTRQFHHLVAFRCVVDVDLDELADFIGARGAEMVRRLPDHHWYYHGPSWAGPMPPVRLGPPQPAPPVPGGVPPG